MEYTLEGYLKLYEELQELEGKSYQASAAYKVAYEEKRNDLDYYFKQDQLYHEQVQQKKEKLNSYGFHLVKENPSNKKIVSTYYATRPYLGGRIYDELSEELKNDKLITLLALSTFDSSSYGRIGEKLRGDKEVMYLLAKNTANVSILTQFNKELLNNESFWFEMFKGDVFGIKRGATTYEQFEWNLKKVNEEYNLGLNIDMILEKYFEEVKENKHEFRTSKLDVAGVKGPMFWTQNLEIINKIVDNDIEAIKHLPESDLRKELLLNERQKKIEMLETLKKEIILSSEQNRTLNEQEINGITR